MKYLAENRERVRERYARMPKSDFMSRNDARNQEIIAAVDAGKMYKQVAMEFGLSSRNVVAGVLHRRAEARA